jgi:thioester reductase-like protein
MTTMTPSYLRMFDQAEFPSLRWLMTVGEAPILSDVRFYAERLEYFNGYGPTENTAAVSVGVINPNEDVVPAGRPLPNVLVMILDAEGRRLPPGAVGEAWIGGASLAIGYSNRPDLTEQVFIQTSFGRMYRTGDMARWRHDGQLIVLGRIDGQVKLRGQRVELGEIEQALICHPLVAQAAAVVAKARDGAQALHAFVVPTDADADWPSLPEWKAFLATTLPGYMIPTGLHCVDAIVMTPSGKIDRKQLERRLSEMPGEGMAAAGRMAPVGRIETAVAEVWASILDCPAPSREDHFFKLGGDSLRAIAVISRLRQKFDLQINDLYEHPVLEDFALRCKPRSNHLRSTIQAAKTHWLGYHSAIREYEAERSALLDPALIEYDARNSAFAMADLGPRADYRHPLLTGATGYVGAYLLRQLLAAPREQLTTLVRASEDAQARLRLLETCTYYFGPQEAERLCNDERLTVLAGDLRRPDLGLERGGFDRLSERVDAVIHSAANVRHFGHYRDFKADNVDATSHLIELARLHARRNSGKTADMHMVSTMSVFGSPPEDGFRLYSEYDPAPDVPDQNYYIRSKQDAERLVSQSRDQIANACIHRVGNIVYAADGGPLQRNIKENAFFRLIGALTRLGLVPDDSHVWLCHVDVVAAAVVALAETPALANFTHHVEHDRRDMLSDFITGGIVTAGKVREASFDRFLEQLAIAVDQPEMETAVADILESFGLLRGISPQARGRRMEVRSDRTQQFLCQLGIEWPEMLSAGQVKMIGAALETDL